MEPKRRFRGLPDLGRAIDERSRLRGNELQVRHDTGTASAAPLGADASGPGGGGDPALPERCVTSLNVTGEDGLDGELELAGVGGTEIFQSSSAPHFTISSPSPLWQRFAPVLTSANSGDRLLLSSSSAMGTIRAGAIGSGNPAIVADASQGYALIGLSSANLGLKLDGICDLVLFDADDVSSAPSGYTRWYSLSDSRAYVVDSEGNRHDLCVQHKQCVSGQQLAAGADGETWESAAYPGGATLPAVAASPVQEFDFNNGRMNEAYGRWSWLAGYSESPPSLTQAQVVTGFPFRKFGDGDDRAGNCRVIMKARIRVNDVSRLDSLMLVLSDNSNHVLSNTLGDLTNGSWSECTLTAYGTDIGAWGEDIYASIWAQGKEHTESGDYQTTLDIERISIEQWVN